MDNRPFNTCFLFCSTQYREREIAPQVLSESFLFFSYFFFGSIIREGDGEKNGEKERERQREGTPSAQWLREPRQYTHKKASANFEYITLFSFFWSEVTVDTKKKFNKTLPTLF